MIVNQISLINCGFFSIILFKTIHSIIEAFLIMKMIIYQLVILALALVYFSGIIKQKENGVLMSSVVVIVEVEAIWQQQL